MSLRVVRGDFQTPDGLASSIVAWVAQREVRPRAVLEPTCGRGSFLRAAAKAFPRAKLVGFDIDATYVGEARAAVPRAQVQRRDFFEVSWERELAALPDPILVVGNPPWVTTATLGALDAQNAPPRSNAGRVRGIEARTGASNFDISEWMTLRLLDALAGRSFVLALLLKLAVGRKIAERAMLERRALDGALRSVDARAHFGASVDAALFVARSSDGPAKHGWPIFDRLDAARPACRIGAIGDVFARDVRGAARTRSLQSDGVGAWRSGLKHDCARVFELAFDGRLLYDAQGAELDVEDEVVFPLLKGSDVANNRLEPTRAVLVPQRDLSDDLSDFEARAPRAHAYLARHADSLASRKSSVYRGRSPFAIFGVGAYSFAPFKVAICGLYKRMAFCLVRPRRGKPVMLDDTCYFLPFATEEEATRALRALESEEARAFFSFRVFWDKKRPLTKKLLDALSLDRLTALLGERPQRAHELQRVGGL